MLNALQVLVHSPLEFPDESAHTKVIGAGTMSLISYVPEVRLDQPPKGHKHIRHTTTLPLRDLGD